MRRTSAAGWALAVGGATVAVGLLLASRARASSRSLPREDSGPPELVGEEPPEELPPQLPAEVPRFPAERDQASALPAELIDSRDIEAGARMLASENPRGSRRLHVEQLWTQIRAAKRDQSLADRITAGSGWGQQGGRKKPGKRRPVATTNAANDAQREIVRSVLEGREPSILPGARKFFEPAQQDKAFAIAERARAKQAKGDPLSDQERRLLAYKKDAAQVRASWARDGRPVGTVDGVEFWT